MPSSLSTVPSGSDLDLGRVPGLLPPVRPRAAWLWLVALLATLGFVVVALVRPPGPLDQADLAYQRDGLLDDGPVLEQRVAGVEFGDGVLVLLFTRQAPTRDEMRRWVSGLAPGREVRLVLPAPAEGDLGVPVVVDPAGRLARAVDLPRPNDGGLGVGYAVVDTDRVVRYATLDPSWLDNAFEVKTIAGSVE